MLNISEWDFDKVEDGTHSKLIHISIDTCIIKLSVICRSFCVVMPTPLLINTIFCAIPYQCKCYFDFYP